MKRRFAALAATMAFCGTAASPAAPPLTVARAPYAFAFPSDHGAHPGYQTEWWYFTGHLRAPGGRRFGYELTFFRIRLRPEDVASEPKASNRSRWRSDQVYTAHFAITDEAGSKFSHAERVARGALGLGSAATGRLDVRVGDWSLRGEPMRDARFEHMTIHAAGGGNGLDLTQSPLKPPAIYGNKGFFHMAACATCGSHYYSYTRLQTDGNLKYGGAKLNVVGTSWMDHSFGTNELESDVIGWNWFSLQLDDGRDLMLMMLRRQDGTFIPQSSGSLIERDGRARPLTLDRFHTTATGRWNSPHTHVDYPSGWRIAVPGAGIDVGLTPVVQDQEIAGTSGPSYWEGAVDIRDATSSRSLGQGYVELTGYAEPIVL